ncbi:MAG: hypothetical protein WED15_07875 [Akkermansiaceae bacterium]
MKKSSLPRSIAACLLVICSPVSAAPPEAMLYELSTRASEIDKRAKAHPEISFLFVKDGKPQDIQRACVDTRVPPQGKLVIWLMGHNRELFARVSSYGLHAIQPHYANGWFGTLYSGPPPRDDLFLSNIRLEAATGADHSKAVKIPPPDSIMERSYQFVKWLDRENPQGNWKQFLTRDGRGLEWEKVILAGISHGATTAARMAKHVKVDRVVMFSGPRDQFEIWQKLPSATPGNRYFGFTHVLDDGWKADHYSRSWQLMDMEKYGPVVNVDTLPHPYGNTRRLISDADVNNDSGRAHNAVTPGGAAVKDGSGKFIHEDVWRYLFTHPVAEVGMAVSEDTKVKMDQRN